jgi:probable F420-dependent oxidoreductase
MKFGVSLYGASLDHAARVEALGFDSVWTSDHILFYGPTLDGLISLAALAGATKRVELGTAIYLLPLRHPVATAKAVGTLDLISGGRVTLGVGVGGEFAKEFEAVGVPVKERGRRVDESIDLMRRLWTEDEVNYQGKIFSLEGARMLPRPVQQPVPIVVAGRSEAAQRRAATRGDGYMPYLFTPERFRQAMEKIGEWRAEAGLPIEGFRRVLYQFTHVSDSLERSREESAKSLGRRYNQPFEGLVDRYAVMGPPEACAARLNEFKEAGVDHFILVSLHDAEPPERFYETMAEKVVPLVRQ